MSRATKDIGEREFVGALDYAEAIITNFDVAACNVNTSGTAYMYPIGVRAITGSRYFEFVAVKIFVKDCRDVESFAVQ